MTEENLKIAVFVDFDNIEIGVKNTLNKNFEIGLVLEAVKDRGEIVTKIAYGDWNRSGSYGRAMGQHAIQMVQRNLTPGGDKNGADINLALDALEMAFTRDHINAFVIVGGDSDFITLVEKLKQYDKKVFVVGGRSFTSVILQKNCHEFIAYENLIRSHSVGRRPSRVRSADEVPLEKAVPLVRRALKILIDREVSPQLGPLKNTLLQLDSTFSERDYAATTFRYFMEKLARIGVINLKKVDRSWLVELTEEASEGPDQDKATNRGRLNSAPETTPEILGTASSPHNQAEGVQVIRSVFEKIDINRKWPIYLRNVKQLIKAVHPDFDEKEYGFISLLEAVRHTEKTGIVRLERNRQGVLRIFPGEEMIKTAEKAVDEDGSSGTEGEVAVESVMSGDIDPGIAKTESTDQESINVEEGAEVKPARKRKAIATKARKTTSKTTKKVAKTAKKNRSVKKTLKKVTKTKRRTVTKKSLVEDEPAESSD